MTSLQVGNLDRIRARFCVAMDKSTVLVTQHDLGKFDVVNPSSNLRGIE